MEQFCDLHTHSIFSDGTLTPRELLQAACDAGLAAVALTDHNTVKGLPDFTEAAKDFSIEAVPGTEFSVDYSGTELHLLALYLKPEHYAPITALMEDFLRRKEQSNIDLVEKLNAAGFALDYEEIRPADAGYVSRAHIAAAMLEKGYVESVKDAFKRYLSPKHGYYTPPQRANVFDMIRFIKSLGAVAVLAHPFLNLEEPQLREFLPEAVKAGMDGMEVFYPLFDAKQTEILLEMTREFSLLPSGGSDFHGANKPHIQIGSGQGDLQVPNHCQIALKSKVFP